MPTYLSSTYVEMYHTFTILYSWFYFDPCYTTKFDSQCTMMVSGFGPYHHLVRADAPTKRAGVILTPWAMPLALGLGAILLRGE
jgi:hypothetical protein